MDCGPGIEFTSAAPYGTDGYVCGRIHCADPGTHGVATYIFVEGVGWWTKPSFEQPVTPIGADSTWCVDIVTGGSDIYATRVHVALVPLTPPPPQCGGCCELPDLSGYALAEADTLRTPRVVSFAGYEWAVKASVGPVGPGPTRFSDSPSSVWADEAGLHLKLRHSGPTWYGAEVALRALLGYGCYSFEVSGPLGRIDPNVVVGFFTWDNDLCPNHREIDMECWRSQADTLNAQYVVQPWDREGNLHRWRMPPEIEMSQHLICWQPDEIRFQSDGFIGGEPIPSPIESWIYTGPDIPTPSAERLRLSIWLQHGDGNAPTDSQEVEVLLRNFTVVHQPR